MYQYFLIYELIKKCREFEFHNLGKGSAGNHVIFHNYKKRIQELLNKGINPKNIFLILIFYFLLVINLNIITDLLIDIDYFVIFNFGRVFLNFIIRDNIIFHFYNKLILSLTAFS